MNSGLASLLAFGIGMVAGLRSMTAPAMVAWAARLSWIHLPGSHLAFMGSAWAVGIFTLAALGEFAADQLPATPPVGRSYRWLFEWLWDRLPVAAWPALEACRLGWGPSSRRLVRSLERSAAIRLAFDWFGRTLHGPDIAIAIPEDQIAVRLALFLVSRS